MHRGHQNYGISPPKRNIHREKDNMLHNPQNQDNNLLIEQDHITLQMGQMKDLLEKSS